MPVNVKRFLAQSFLPRTPIMACFFSLRHVYLFLFTLLFIIDVVTDIAAVIQWYQYNYFKWFIIGSSIVTISFIMQWMYCTNNMNSYLTYLQSFKYASWSNYNYYQAMYSDTRFTQRQHATKPRHKLSKCKEMSSMILKFLFKSIVLHLLCQFGIIEAFIANISVLDQFNNNKKGQKQQNIFNFDHNSNSKTILQFNSNFIISKFADLCLLHCYFESVAMALLHCTFCLHQLFSSLCPSLCKTVYNHTKTRKQQKVFLVMNKRR